MSSTKIAPKETGLPQAATDLFLPVIHTIIDAGENLMGELRKIAVSQGLCSKGMAVAIWRLHLGRGLIKVTDLAQIIDCDAGNTSGLLDRLEEAGLVERVHSGDDRRVRLIQLTAKGRKLGTQMESDYRRSWIYQELKELPQRDRDVLEDILERLNGAASRAH